MFGTIVRRCAALPRPAKRWLTILADTIMLPLALWAAFALRFGEILPPLDDFWWLFIATPLLAIPVLKGAGLYRAVLRYMGPQAVLAVLKGVTVSAVLVAALALMGDSRGLPRTVPILYWLNALLYVGGSRLLLRALLQSLTRQPLDQEPVIIYGAGAAGAQLLEVLSQGGEYLPVALIDDDPALAGSVVRGVAVHPAAELEKLVERWEVQQVLLATPSASRQRRRAILNRLEPLAVHVRTVPSLTDIVSGRARPDEVREVDVEDLLGRDPVPPHQELLDRCIRGRSVLVTGAGGSIGAELCRQILLRQPRRLVLYDVAEFALYRVERDLAQLIATSGSAVELVPLLGSVGNRSRMFQALRQFDVATVYHAAAYKHVPIVEHNVVEGVQNNVIGTLQAAQAARDAGVESFVLVSTDKAVRPTNVMGASKRMGELVLQALAQLPGPTVFSMVRFGNVLGSSGSVVPLFREQIRSGGPVTVTDPKVTRYFMTIPEAAALVIQAGSMAQGGEVFVLDMGQPVQIADLARKMIRLMGLQVRDERHPDGDVAIVYTGLRPGEKLYEELLIGDNVTDTPHPMIMRAEETAYSWNELQLLLDELQQACTEFNGAGVRSVLQRAVPEYAPQGSLREYLAPADATDSLKVRWLPTAGGGD